MKTKTTTTKASGEPESPNIDPYPQINAGDTFPAMTAQEREDFIRQHIDDNEDMTGLERWCVARAIVHADNLADKLENLLGKHDDNYLDEGDWQEAAAAIAEYNGGVR